MNESDEICFVCGENNPVVLQRHHIIPRRYAGSDGDENLVTLCANCHEAVEHIYTDEVITQLGRAWKSQQPDVGISDILRLLKATDAEDFFSEEGERDLSIPLDFGKRLAAAYHSVGTDFLQEILTDLVSEAQQNVMEGRDPTEGITIHRSWRNRGDRGPSDCDDHSQRESGDGDPQIPPPME
jgi:hypothetical protein